METLNNSTPHPDYRIVSLLETGYLELVSGAFSSRLQLHFPSPLPNLLRQELRAYDHQNGKGWWIDRLDDEDLRSIFNLVLAHYPDMPMIRRGYGDQMRAIEIGWRGSWAVLPSDSDGGYGRMVVRPHSPPLAAVIEEPLAVSPRFGKDTPLEYLRAAASAAMDELKNR